MRQKRAGADISGLKKSKICFLSNFPPKECGIATFTRDLTIAMNKKFNPLVKSKVVALNEETDIYNYGEKVILQIDKEDIDNYIKVAKEINQREDIKIISIQHEFGLFGGEQGSYIIPFLETLEKPVVVTFHSVVPDPSEIRRKVVKAICDRSSAIIVMAKKAIDILNKDYHIEKGKIRLVYHGIPNVSFSPIKKFKEKLNLKGKIVLSTFGLLSKGKGIEYMIKALPPLVKKYPNLVYLVMGETHPAIRKIEGEEYRNSLVELVKKLGLKNNVKFYNRYLSLSEIISYLLATDIYICTNLDQNQIVSGTLSYALGCGKAIVSTPTVYAKEILSENRGVIVQFESPQSYTKAIEKIFSDNGFRKSLEKNAYSFGRKMIWSNIASRYLSIFNKVVSLRDETVRKYPSIKLTYLKKLTDKTGIIQFAKLSVPDKRSGYTVDDNSRALIASILHNNLFSSKLSLNLSKTYLDFLEYAQEEGGNFKNNHKNKNEFSNTYSEDAFGRAIWALGFAIKNSENIEIEKKAKELLNRSYPLINNLSYLRSIAFSIIGLSHYYKKYPDKDIKSKIKELSDKLIDAYQEESSGEWNWFESILTYSNSKLPEALFFAYEITKEKNYLKVAEKSLDFLTNILFIEDRLSLIGQNGWRNRDGKGAFFDQQPIDASSMVQTYVIAYKITGKKEYYNKAVLSFNWFLGKNHLKQMIYDEATGGCYDGLSESSVNLNQGAESTISYLIARLFLEELKKNKLFK